ncbi:MAG: glycerophosphodiester phosphodiesterase family protein [Hyphomonadaceae bacterium]|nr:glycerophosphodiester phosphodiesterase family protein [Hyphomonadaceae bacterium]
MTRPITALLASLLCVVFLEGCARSETTNELSPRMQAILKIAHDPTHPAILVEAHRGSWTMERPENSVPAIEHAIEIGVDWIELDVSMTRDKKLLLMHDETLDRTTTLSGQVEDHTFAEIRASNLKQENGVVTEMHPPSLDEALDLMAGRSFFRLDLKCTPACEDQVYDLVESKGLLSHAVLTQKLRYRALSTGLSDDQIIVVGDKIEDIDHPDLIPNGVDYVQVKDFPVGAPPRDLMAAFATRVRLVVYPYDDERSGGHGDRLSIEHPDAGWGWLLESGGNIFLTDRAEALIDYLDERGLRDAAQ